MQNIFTKEITSKRTIKATLIAVGMGIGFIVFGGVLLLSLYLGDKYIYDVFYKEIFQEPIWYLFLSLTFIITSLLGIWLVFEIKKLKTNNKSFTLIELLVVIAIIGVLAAIVVVNMSGATDKAKIAKGQAFSAKIGIELADSVVSKWNFDEGTGVTAKDPWEENNGTLGGGTSDYYPIWKSEGECVSGSCLEFDGSGDYIEVVSNESLKPTIITVEVWVKLIDSTLRRQLFLTKWYGYSCETDTDHRPFFRIYNGGDSPKGSALIVGDWYHFVGVYDPSVNAEHQGNTLYINGVRIGTTINSNSITHSNNILTIGKYTTGGLYWGGLIDEVRIYNSAADLSQVQLQYLAGLDKLLSNGAISKSEYNQRINKLSLDR